MAVHNDVICSGRCSDFGGISGHSVFCDGIYDLFAVLVFIKICKSVFPEIAFIQCRACNLGSVCQQAYGNGVGTNAVLVDAVGPDLFNRDTYLTRRVNVFKDALNRRRGNHKSGVSGNIGFRGSIHN